jgi:hypothetical protein
VIGKKGKGVSGLLESREKRVRGDLGKEKEVSG